MPKKNLLIISLLFFLALICSCQQKVKLENFDTEAWRNDKYGCDSTRMQLKEDLLINKSAIVGESERAIMNTLGKPDKVEIFPRNVKHLVYFTEPAPECSTSLKKNPERLIIEINSLGQASLLYLQNP